MANPFQHEHTRIDRGRLLVDNDLEPRTLDITSEGFLTTILKTQINDLGTYQDIGVQNPLPTKRDGLYPSDLVAELSNMSLTGDIENLLGSDNFRSTLIDIGAENPKHVYFRFRRPVLTSLIGFAAITGDFSNVKLTASQMNGFETILYDGSTDSTKRDVFVVKIKPINFMGLKIEFFTSDPVSLSGVAAARDLNVVARFQALQPDGTVVDIGATSSGNLKVTDVENGLAIAKGEVSGAFPIHKFGKAPNFDIADGYVTLWDGADDAGLAQMQYVYTTTSPINTISSSSTGDTQEVEIQGLDFTTKELVIQTKSLDGQNKVTLDTPLFRVFRVKNQGSTKFAGTFYCYEDTAIVTGVPTDTTKVKAVIAIGINVKGNNQTQMALFTIPAGYSAYANDIYVSPAGAKKISVHNWQLHSREDGGTWQIKLDKTINIAASGDSEKKYSTPEKFEALTDLELSVNTDENDAGISGGFDLVLVENV